ncbi:MAG: hypothetical protein IT222_10995 [Crocinitomix sp.]|nr:hypothetical protein [Crocinitomix sp.]
MKSIEKFSTRRITFSESSIVKGGDRIKGDTPGTGQDVTVTRDGQVVKFITGAGMFDGVDRD